jgi:hypothetical protein
VIGKLNKGAGFRGCLNYVLEKDGATVIDSSMTGESPRELAHEFGVVRDHNRMCKRPVFHASLSASPGEKLSDLQWSSVAKDYLEKMGFDVEGGGTQYVIVRHTDRQHDHVHIVANRVNAHEFSVVSDKYDFSKQMKALREIEKSHSLRPLVSSFERSPSLKGAAADVLRGKIKDGIEESGGSRAGFIQAMGRQGVNVKLNVQSTGRIAGISFQCESGEMMKGSQLGRDFSWNAINSKVSARGFQLGADVSSEAADQSLAKQHFSSAGLDKIAGTICQKTGVPTSIRGAGVVMATAFKNGFSTNRPNQVRWEDEL